MSFNTVDVFVDSGAEALAAYQLDFDAKAGGVRIVGIEGGSHPAFNESPHFDPKAIQQDRVILAAFNTATREKLPTGRTRVATIHLMVTGTRAAEFEVKLTAAGTAGGKRISAKASIEENEPK